MFEVVVGTSAALEAVFVRSKSPSFQRKPESLFFRRIREVRSQLSPGMTI